MKQPDFIGVHAVLLAALARAQQKMNSGANRTAIDNRPCPGLAISAAFGVRRKGQAGNDQISGHRPTIALGCEKGQDRFRPQIQHHAIRFLRPNNRPARIFRRLAQHFLNPDQLVVLGQPV